MHWGYNMDLIIPNMIIMRYTQDFDYTLVINLRFEIKHYFHNYFVAYYKLDLFM